MDQPVFKPIALCLVTTFVLPFCFIPFVHAGGQSQETARRAMCEVQMTVCEADFGTSKLCSEGYLHCIEKGAFPIPDILQDPVKEDSCEQQMRECRDPNWTPSPTHSDGTKVTGD